MTATTSTTAASSGHNPPPALVLSALATSLTEMESVGLDHARGAGAVGARRAHTALTHIASRHSQPTSTSTPMPQLTCFSCLRAALARQALLVPEHGVMPVPVHYGRRHWALPQPGWQVHHRTVRHLPRC